VSNNLATTDGATVNDGAASTVSWQTAFALLFGMALNTMAQPCGRVAGYPIEQSIWLRSSPIICLLDTLVMISQLAVYRYLGDSFRDATRRIITFRFLDSIKSDPSSDPEPQQFVIGSDSDVELSEMDITDNTSGPQASQPVPTLAPTAAPVRRESFLPEIEKRLSVRFVFSTGSLIWIVGKLYTLSGIPGTQVLASFYLASFLSVEFVVWMSTPLSDVATLPSIDDPFHLRSSAVIQIFQQPEPRYKWARTLLLVVPALLLIYSYLAITNNNLVYDTFFLSLLAGSGGLFLSMVWMTGSVKIQPSVNAQEWLVVVSGVLLDLHYVILAGFYFTFSNPSWLVFLLTYLPSIASPAQDVLSAASKLTVRDVATAGAVLACCLCAWHVFSTVESTAYAIVQDVLVTIIMCLTILPLALMERVYYKLFAAKNLAYALAFYSILYKPDGTYSPSWESIWG
jgi:hypothetical protein